MKLDWKNLKYNRCPQCGNDIDRTLSDDFKCLKCGFFCRESLANQIINDINNKKGNQDQEADDFFRANGSDPKKI
jgi:tRNA(Ile2) C34 agmatinyltransferase TiaS